MRSCGMRFSGAVLFCGALMASLAWAEDVVVVKDWLWCHGAKAYGCVNPGDKVPTFFGNGSPAGFVNPATVKISGRRDHDLEMELVLLQGKAQNSNSLWVHENALNLEYCSAASGATRIADPGRRPNERATGLSSGAGCPQ